MNRKELQKKIDAIKEFTPSQKNAIQTMLRQIASVCDGAQDLDGFGFNKHDSSFGKSLASQTSRLSHRQALAGIRLAYKYRRQLSSSAQSLLNRILDGKDDQPTLGLGQAGPHEPNDIMIFPVFVSGTCERIHVVSRSAAKEIASFLPEEWSDSVQKNLYEKGLKSVDIEEIEGILSINN